MINKSTKKIEHAKNPAIFWMFLSAILITLYINPKLADPFNAPKLYLLMLFSIILLGQIFFNKLNLNSYKNNYSLLVVFFLIMLAFATIFTDLKYTAIFGETQRQLGLLTYIGFSIFTLVAAKFFRIENKNYLHYSILIIGMIYSVYGLLQFTKNDPFKWINQYNPIILTLGNPNFAGAFMAMLATLTFSFLFDKSLGVKIKLLFGVLTTILTINIYLSSARQGLLSIILGTSIFLCIKIYDKSKRNGSVAFLGLAICSSFVLAGIFQFGPLAKSLYKESISLRGYYWRAGLEMFKNNIFTGVGIDRYGVNFKNYREIEFPVKYGFELISTNAHNVIIQLFATGGIFLGVAYLSLNIAIIFYARYGLKKLEGNNLVLLGGIFSSWLAFQFQSIVSIDNIGLTIWGWILGGLVVAISSSGFIESTKKQNSAIFLHKRNNQTSILQPIFTVLLLIPTFIFVLMLSKSESMIFNVRSELSIPQNNANSNLNTELNTLANDKLAQPFYKLEVADDFYRLGFKNEGIALTQKLITVDNKNPIFYNTLATMLEANGNLSESVKIRKILIEHDPYNAKNYLQLARLYKALGDIENALIMKEKIISFAPKSEVAQLAIAEIK